MAEQKAPVLPDSDIYRISIGSTAGWDSDTLNTWRQILGVIEADGLDPLPNGKFERAVFVFSDRRAAELFCGALQEVLGTAVWPVVGTTGYEFIAALADAMVDPAGAEPLSGRYVSFTGSSSEFSKEVQTAKTKTMSWNLASELRQLTDALLDIAQGDLVARDFGATTLARAIAALAAALPVYRTYADGSGIKDGPQQRKYILHRNPGISFLWDSARNILSLGDRRFVRRR